MLAPFCRSSPYARALVNLEQRYQLWMEAEQTLHAPPPYDLRRKLVDRRAELYAINDRGGNAKSLGPWSHENEARFADYHKRKTTAKVRQDASPVALHETDDFDVAWSAVLVTPSRAATMSRQAERNPLKRAKDSKQGVRPCR